MHGDFSREHEPASSSDKLPAAVNVWLLRYVFEAFAYTSMRAATKTPRTATPTTRLARHARGGRIASKACRRLIPEQSSYQQAARQALSIGARNRDLRSGLPVETLLQWPKSADDEQHIAAQDKNSPESARAAQGCMVARRAASSWLES